jgi:hypothetical protein
LFLGNRIIIKMNFRKLIAAILICFFTMGLSAQSDNSSEKKHKFSLYAGVGPNIYFNNLVLAKDYVHELNYSFAGRIMWEPGHLLSLGVETGYYRLYSVNDKSQSGVNITNAAIPIQLVVGMKFLKTFYFNFSSGQSILLNKVSTPNNGSISSTSFSLGDFGLSLGYKRQLNERLSLAAETKFFYSSQLNDKNIALLFMVGYKL